MTASVSVSASTTLGLEGPSIPLKGSIDRKKLICSTSSFGAYQVGGKIVLLTLTHNWKTHLADYEVNRDPMTLLEITSVRLGEKAVNLDLLKEAHGFSELVDDVIEQLSSPDNEGIPYLFSIKSSSSIRALVSMLGDTCPEKLLRAFKSSEHLLPVVKNLRYFGPFLTFLKSQGVPLEPFSAVVQKVCERDSSHFWKSIPLSSEDRAKIEALSPEEKGSIERLNLMERNIHVYEPASVFPYPKAISINFCWINREAIPEEQETLFLSTPDSSGHEESFTERVVLPLRDWSEKNPGVDINLWYDSDLVPQAVVDRTFALLVESMSEEQKGCLHLRSIRSLKLVEENPDFFAPEVPVYFRVDLVKLLVLWLMASKEEGKYFAATSDLDVTPMSTEQLFNAKTLCRLKANGFLAGKSKFDAIENSFSLLYGGNKDAVASIEREIFASEDGIFRESRCKRLLKKKGNEGLNEYVYKYVYMPIWEENYCKIRFAPSETPKVVYFETPASRFG